MGIKIWQSRTQLANTLVYQRDLKCTCVTVCTCVIDIERSLNKVNYFQIFNGLENIFLVSHSPKKFGNFVTLKDFERLYNFDKNISNEIFKAINVFEEKLQTSISYYFTEAYCRNLNNTMEYTNKLNYNDISLDTAYPFSRGQYKKIVNGFNGNGNSEFKLFRQNFLDKLVNNNDMIQMNFYRDNTYIAPNNVSKFTRDNNVAVPFWVAVQTFDFGILKFLCHYLKNDEMKLVLADFGLTLSQRNMFLNALDVISELRNHCAHGRLIFKFKTPEYIKLHNNFVNRYSLNPVHGNGTRTTSYSVINLFDALIVLSDFVSVKPVLKLFKKLIYLNNKHLKENSERVNNNILSAIKVSSYAELKRLS